MVNTYQSKYSGCTACVVLVRNDTLYIANLGDSRAVLAQHHSGGDNPRTQQYKAIDLTYDQHPALPEERTRIERSGGHVSFSEGAGRARVWLDAQCSKYGLAMSRAIGDHAMKGIGVSAEPVVSTHTLTDEDEFLILATDGVWSVLDSSQAVDLVGELLDSGEGASVACGVLIETAMEIWRACEGDYRDDVTAVVVRMKDLWKKEVNSGRPVEGNHPK